MVDWGAYPDVEEEEVVSRLNSLNFAWLSKKWVKILTVVVFLIGVALIIAGSIMLGIGVSKSNQAPSCPAISASPFYATVESTELTYNDVISNYSHASDMITNQVRSAALGQSQKASFAAADSNTDPVVTVLGMSKSPSGHVMAVVGIAFTTADAVAPDTLQNNLNNAQQLSLYNTGTTAANSTNQQMCNSVSMYTETSKTNATVAPTTTTTPQGCDCSCASSTAVISTTTESTSTSTTTTSPSTSTSSSTTTTKPVTSPTSTVTTTTNPPSTSTSSTVTTTTVPVTSPSTITSSSTVTTTTVPVTSPTSTTTPSSTVTTTTVPVTSPSSTTSSSTVTTTTVPVTSPSTTTSSSTVTTTTVPVTSPSTTTSSSTVTTTTVPVTSPSTTTSSSTVTTTTVPVTSPTSTAASSSTVTITTVPVTSPSTTASSSTVTTTTVPVTSPSTTTSQSSVTTTTLPVTSPSTTMSSSTVTTTTVPVTSPTSTATSSPSTTTSTSSSSMTTTPLTSTQSTSTVSSTVTTPTTSTSPSTLTSMTSTSTAPTTTTASTTSPTSTSTSSTSTTTVTTKATTALLTTLGSTTTAAVTTPACVWSTEAPLVPNRPGARDIVVLIDDSTAVGGYQNYSQVTNWLAKQLFPLWPVSDERWEAAPAQYAEHEYNLLMDFDATSSSELSKAVSNSVYTGRNSPSITKALKSTMSLGGRLGVKRFVLLLSASSNLTDIESALPLAEAIRQSGSSIITFAVGDADTDILGMLSSGSNYDFSSDSFTLTSDQAIAITDLIQGQQETTVSTTVPTTTPAPFDFPCHPDIAVVVDTSSAVPSDDEYRRQLSFIADTLAPSWSIGTNGLEAEIIVYSSAYGGNLGLGAFGYQNTKQFSTMVHQFDGYHNQFAISSISGSLEYLVSTENNRRPGRAPTTLLFTYSGAYHDVATAQDSLSSLGNLIVVSMTNNSQYLTSLSGNLITGTYGDAMTTSINSLLCQPSSPVPLTSTVPPSTSTTTMTTSTTTISTQQTTTSVAPVSCVDCYPDEANVLVSMDASSMMTGGKLDQLKSFVNNQLTSSWNHAERLAILSFDDQTHFDAPVDFGDLQSMAEYHELVGAAPQLPNPPSLTSAFKRALSNFYPQPKYGQMSTVIFTISTNDAQNAIPYAKQLRQKGKVILVAMEITNLTALNPLSKNIVSWPSLNDTTGIAEQIEAFLGSGAPVTGKSTTTTPSTSTTSITTSEATTTTPHVTPSVSCGRDVILMVDESNAFPDLASFQKVQSWLVSSLIPLWDVSPSRIAVAPFGYTNKTWDDLGGDFQLQSPQELDLLLQTNLFYRSTMSPGLTSALRKATAVEIPQPSAATLLISASDASGDVSKAKQYAKQLRQNGGTVITLAVGPNTNGNLHLLSSGPKFSFNSPTFDISQDIALEISEMLCASAPTGPTSQGTTTTPATTTTTAPPPFSCNPDVALLFDNSGVNSNETQFENLVLYTSNLVNDWVVGPQATEASIVMANAVYGVFDTYPWQYQSKYRLQQELMDMSTEYFGGEASITNMLTNLNFPARSRRQEAPFTVLMFTFSSDYQDVLSAIPVAKYLHVTNIVAVGLGNSDPNVLGLLTGNVITGLPPGDALRQAIDAAICNPKAPSVVVTTPTTSTSTTSTSSSTTTTVASTTTEPTPMGCPDCYPSMSNLLILMDNSNDQSPSTFSDQQQAVISLVSQWNHFERVGLSAFAGSLQPLVFYNDLGKTELGSLVKTINNLQQTTTDVDLGRSLYMANGIKPDPGYGEQKTILFTATNTVSDKAVSAAATLRSKGQLIVVGVGLADVGDLGTLASTGDAFAWGNVDQPQDVVESIMGALGATSRPTQQVQTTTQAQTTKPTSGTTTQPTICSQNLLLLLDESNAIPTTDNFNQLKTWVTTKLIPGLPPIAVGPYGYADKDWNDINGGEFLADAYTEEMLINVTYSYKAQNGPNIARALQRAAALQPDGSLTTVLISASAGTDDVAKALPYSNLLKEEGAVMTLLIGNGDLSSLASDPSLTLTSATFTPDDSIVTKIASVLCVPYTPPSTVVTTTPSTTTTTVTTTISSTTPTTTFPTTTTTPSTTSTTISSSTSTTPQVTTTIIPDASYYPAMADIVILFDVSTSVNDSALAAQKSLINSLVSNWNHFERVAIEEFAAQPMSIAEFTDLSSSGDVATYVQNAVKPMGTASDLSNALKFTKKHYPVESGMPGRNVVLMTAFTATAAAAGPSAVALQTEGSVIVVSLSVSDTSALVPLASPNSLVTFNDFSDVDKVAEQVNQLLGQTAIPSSKSTPSTTTTVPNTSTSPSQVCSQNLILLLDESNAIPTSDDFNQFKTWVTAKLIPGLPTIAMAPFGYADKVWNSINGGAFLTSKETEEMLINASYLYQSSYGPNITKALKIASTLDHDGTLTTLLISASAGADDVAKALPYSNQLKEEGAVVTLLIGNGDLSSLASDPSMALTSATFTPDDSIIAKIASVLCVPYIPPSTVVTTTPSTTTTTVTTQTSTIVPTTTVPLTTSTSTTFTTSTSTTPSTTPSTTSPTTTFIPDASYNPAEADIVIIFDVCLTVNSTELTAQKTLVSSLVTKWNHFERLALMDFAAQGNSVSNFGEISSASGVNDFFQALYPMNSPGDLSSALKFAKKYYPIEPGMPGRNVVLMTSSAKTAASAQSAATALQNDGKLIVVSLSIEDNSPLIPLASANSLVAFNDFTEVDSTVAQINSLLGSSTVPLTTASTVTPTTVAQTTPSTVTTPKVATTTVPDQTTTLPLTTTIDRYIPTQADLVIVFDVSLGANGTIAAQKNLATSLVSGWTHFERVAMMEFSGQPAPVSSFGELSSAASFGNELDSVFQQYSYANLAMAMEWLPKFYPLEQGMTSRNIVFLTTSANGASDVQSYSDSLRSQGSLIIVSVGSFDPKPLTSLATSVVQFTDFSKTAATAAQINKLL